MTDNWKLPEVGLVMFDLDGTIITSYMTNPNREYHAWESIHPAPGIIDELLTKNYQVSVVTNQGGVAFGLVTEQDFWAKAATITLDLGFNKAEIYDGRTTILVGWKNVPSGAVLLAFDQTTRQEYELGRAPIKAHPRKHTHNEAHLRFIVSYEHPKAKLPQYAGSERRKPSPVMLEEAIAYVERFHGGRQWWPLGITFVGDSPTDQQAAEAAGARFCTVDELDDQLFGWSGKESE